MNKRSLAITFSAMILAATYGNHNVAADVTEREIYQDFLYEKGYTSVISDSSELEYAIVTRGNGEEDLVISVPDNGNEFHVFTIMDETVVPFGRMYSNNPGMLYYSEEYDSLVSMFRTSGSMEYIYYTLANDELTENFTLMENRGFNSSGQTSVYSIWKQGEETQIAETSYGEEQPEAFQAYMDELEEVTFTGISNPIEVESTCEEDNAGSSDLSVGDCWVSEQYFPFYGIFCGASEELDDEIIELLETYIDNGFDAGILLTDDWSELNPGWYALTAGYYPTYESAEADLQKAQNIIPDAYIKYAGEFIGERSDSEYLPVCISEITTDAVTYYPCRIERETPRISGPEVTIPMNEGAQIRKLEEQSPIADYYRMSPDLFANDVKEAKDRNGNGFYAYMTILNGECLEITEPYWP